MASQAFSSSVPQAASFSPKPHDNIFPTPYWRDLWAAVLYYVSLAAFLALAGLNINYLVHNGGPVTSFSSLPEIQITLITQGVVLLVASLLTALYVFLLYKFTEGMIKFSFLGTGVIMIIMGAISLFTGLAIHGVIMLVFAALQFLLYFFWRSRIPFSAALLRNALKITSEYPAIIVVAFLSFFTTLSLVAICLASMTGLAVMSEKEAYSKGFIKASGLYSLFSFLWSCGVIENVGAVTISGVFATRYFLGKQQALVVNPTSESFKRAMTYSFGSICFGSLLVAIVQFLKALVDSSNDRNSLAGAIISCLLGLIRDLLAYFNKYAFTHIAIYGKPYLEAGKDTWELIKRRGVEAIINDSLVGTALTLGCIFIALVCVQLSEVSMMILGLQHNIGLRVINLVLALVISLFIGFIITAVIESGVTTTFVCLAEDPAALRRNDPELYNEISSRYGNILL